MSSCCRNKFACRSKESTGKFKAVLHTLDTAIYKKMLVKLKVFVRMSALNMEVFGMIGGSYTGHCCDLHKACCMEMYRACGYKWTLHKGEHWQVQGSTAAIA